MWLICFISLFFFPVGKPIPVVKNELPSQEEIDKLHALYVESLKELFEEHKTKYDIAESEHLTFY